MKWLAVIIVAFVLASAGPPNQAQPQAVKPAAKDGVIAKVIALYEIRLEAAKLDLKYDETEVAYHKDRCENFQKMSESGSVSEHSLKESKLQYERAKLERDMSKNFIREVEAQIELLKEGFLSAAITLDDIKLGVEPRQRRK
jgi:outer membrane protein TolC